MFMPKLGTTHRRNRLSSRVAAGLLLAIAIIFSTVVISEMASCQASSAAPAPSNQPTNVPNSAQTSASTAPAQSTTPATQSPGSQASPANQAPGSQPPAEPGQAQAPDANDNGVFVFKAEAREVVLHATEVDDRNHLVMNLDKPDFTVYENDKPQQISSFKQQDFPVAMGIVIDNSGSMREKRDQVNRAAINLVRSSNPDDEVFVGNFNDEYYLDQDFTSDIKKLQAALEHVETRGGTALYDAI